MRILITGASGMLGTVLSKALEENHEVKRETHSYGDITVPVREIEADLVIHLAALTDVVHGDENKDLYYKVNVEGTRNVATSSTNIMYWSTEYVFDGTKGNYTEYDTPNPVNFYGLSKLLGEYEARKCKVKSVVVRTAFKPRPYKHPQVPKGMYTTGGYIDDMVKEFKLAVDHFWDLPPTINIGTEKMLLTDLARQTRKITEIDINSLPVRLPLDASLDLSTWRRLKKRWI